MSGPDGEVRLLEVVAARFGDRLLAFAKVLTQDPHRAEDCRSELWCRLVHLIRGDPRFATFDPDEATDDEWEVLYEHLAGCMLNLHRNARRLVERRSDILAESGPPDWLRPRRPDPLAGLLCEWLLEQMSRADARVLVMRHARGMPIAPIAAKLGCSETAVTSRLSRARRRARKIAGVTKRGACDM